MLKRLIRLTLVLQLLLPLSLASDHSRSDSTRSNLATESTRSIDHTASVVTSPLPFRPGETLTYDVSFSKFLFSGSIGRLTLNVSDSEAAAKKEMIEFKAEAVSKGFFTWVFGIDVRDQFTAQVSAKDLGLHTSIKRLHEGKLKREHKSIIDRASGRVTYIERDLISESTPPKVKEAESPSWVQDALSAIYLVRTKSLKEGERITVPISDAAKVYNIEVVAVGIDNIKVDAGRFKAMKLDAKIFGGRYITRSGEMTVWVSDDELRIPVRARIKTAGVTVTIQLERVQFQSPSGSGRGSHLSWWSFLSLWHG